MQYIIYELVSPSHLSRIDNSGYSTHAISRSILEELDDSSVVSNGHKTFDDAMAEIVLNKEKLKSRKLTILPVIDINWDGKIY